MIQEAISELETQFELFRNAKHAESAAAYMKDNFKYIGMRTEVRRATQKSWIDALKTLEDRTIRWNIIRALFEKEERDYHYVAIDWLNSWPKKYYSEEDAENLKWILSTNCWWDSVDAIASNYLGKWAKQFPEKARKSFENWRNSENFWLKRSCLIYQLKYKDEVDIPYLENLIVQFLPIKEFFIQKAIGWSLRQLSKFNPEAVEEILRKHAIKGLAYREASKYL
jgi:3-methyladenine DNA glycosylase AlkD